MENAMCQMQFTARTYYFRIQKLARTIADLEGKEQITAIHVAEALQYRPQVFL